MPQDRVVAANGETGGDQQQRGARERDPAAAETFGTSVHGGLVGGISGVVTAVAAAIDLAPRGGGIDVLYCGYRVRRVVDVGIRVRFDGVQPAGASISFHPLSPGLLELVTEYVTPSGPMTSPLDGL